jgi:hypothetical protein
VRNCSRCNSSSPTGLRFCNGCGARLDEAQAEDLVFGNLALAPEKDAHYVPPRHLRAVPRETPVERARALASRARELAGVAGRAAAEAASEVATKVAAQLQSVSLPSIPAPPISVPEAPASATATVAPVVPEAAPLRLVSAQAGSGARDLRAAYELYRRGRTAYDAGDRARATQLFAAALSKAPPESPLGQFLARVVKVRGRPKAAAASAAPVAPVVQAAPVQVATGTVSPPATRTTASSARGASAGGAPEARPVRSGEPSAAHGLVDLSGTGPAIRARRTRSQPGIAREDDGAGVARHRRLPLAERRSRARKAAQRQWLRSLPAKSPNRPSQLLDGAGDGTHIERLAGAIMIFSGLGFLALLLL